MIMILMSISTTMGLSLLRPLLVTVVVDDECEDDEHHSYDDIDKNDFCHKHNDDANNVISIYYTFVESDDCDHVLAAVTAAYIGDEYYEKNDHVHTVDDDYENVPC